MYVKSTDYSSFGAHCSRSWRILLLVIHSCLL